MAPSPRAFVLRHTRLRPVPASRRCASTWRTRCFRSGGQSRSRRTTRTQPCRTGRSRGRAAWPSGDTCGNIPRPSSDGGCSTWPPGPGCARSRRCGPARRRRWSGHRRLRGRGDRAERARQRLSRVGRPARRPGRGPARGGRHPGGRLLVRGRSRRARASLAARRSRREASTCWSATPGAGTCRPGSWSSWPRTTSGRRPSWRTAIASAAASTGCARRTTWSTRVPVRFPCPAGSACPAAGSNGEIGHMSGPAGMTPPPAPMTLGPQTFCIACGQQIDARAEICPRCGVRQRAAAGSGSGKDRVVTIILALLLGWIGGHKFYLGKVAQGVIYLLFSWTGIPGLIAWIEAIVYLTTSDESWAATHGGPSAPIKRARDRVPVAPGAAAAALDRRDHRAHLLGQPGERHHVQRRHVHLTGARAAGGRPPARPA